MRNGQGWLMNPASKDYDQSLGAPVLDASLKMPIYFRTMVPRTQWLYAPNNLYGSDFWTAHRRQIQGTTTTMKAIQQRALRPLIQDGRARSISVGVNNAARNGVALDVTYVNASGNEDSIGGLKPIGI